MKKFIFSICLLLNFMSLAKWKDEVLDFYEAFNLEDNDSKFLEDLYIKKYEKLLNTCKAIIEEKTGQKVGSRIRENAFCELMAIPEATKRAIRSFKKTMKANQQ